jgi:hypothetical protein
LLDKMRDHRLNERSRSCYYFNPPESAPHT